jgi:two-component system cell cycle response regulator
MPLPPLSRLEALGLASDEPVPDVFLVVADRDFHGASLSVLTELRSNPETRHSMVMMVLPGFAIDDSAIALDLGADDLVMDGFNPDELALRLNALVQRKRQNDALRARVKDGLKATVIDPLTGLYNRRYAISHLARVAETSTETGKSFAVMLLDLDHFKQINDTYGHAVGDDVLCAVAQRLQDNLRPFDLVARIGGEEFLVAMPNSPESQAIQAANRLCEIIAATPIRLPKHGVEVSISTSIGVAIGTPDCECPDRISELLQSADVALYRAKSDGRNQVLLSQTAA